MWAGCRSPAVPRPGRCRHRCHRPAHSGAALDERRRSVSGRTSPGRLLEWTPGKTEDGGHGMLTTGDFKKGLRLLIEGQPYEVMDYTVQSPTARGSATLVRTRIRQI